MAVNAVEVILSGGKHTPKTISTTKTISRKGVRNLPIMLTILDFDIDKAVTTAKNKTMNHTLGKAGNKGCMPTSKVVAAVRGIATKGPMHKITNNVRILMSQGCVFFPKSVK